MSKPITIDELKALVKEEKIQPSDIYGVDDLTTDPLVKGYVGEVTKELRGKLTGEFEHRKRDEAGFDKTKEKIEQEFQEKEKEYQSKIAGLQKESAKIKSADLFKAKIKERKLTDQQAAFVKAEIPYFEVEDVEKLEKEVDDFLDNTLKDCKEKAKIFGVGESEPEPTPGSEPSDGGSGSADHIPD